MPPTAAETESVASRWLLQRIAPVRRWLVGAAVAGLLASAAYAAFAAALARVIDGWSRRDWNVGGDAGWLLLALMPAALLACSAFVALKEWTGARAAVRVRLGVRDELLDALAALGPLRSAAGADGALAGVLIEQVDALDGYIARYRPQQAWSRWCRR